MKQLVLALILSNGIIRGSHAQSFAPLTTYSTGAYNTYPTDIEAVDLNNDGYADLISSNANTSDLAVLLNKKNGTFLPAVTYSTGLDSRPGALAVGDINNDGYVDVVTANGWAYKLTASLNKGNGTFAAYTEYYPKGSNRSTSIPLDVALSDVNKDGYADLVATVGNTTGTVQVFLNQKNGTFAQPASYQAAGIEPVSVVLDDVNGDTYPDIVTVLQNDDQVEVLLNQRNGTFATPVTYSAGPTSAPDGLALSDVNHDGYPDIITGNAKSATAGVLLNQQNGTFGPVTLYDLGSTGRPYLNYHYRVATGDIDKDGFADIAVTKGDGDVLTLLLNKQNGTFGVPATYATGLNSAPSSVSLHDVNNDGKLDLLTATYQACRVGVFLSTTALAAQANQVTRVSADLYPNPTTGGATLSYSLPAPTTVSAQVFDQTGRLVLVLAHHQQQGSGRQALTVPPLPTGLYTVQLLRNGASVFHKLAVN